ncbi:uncharacterized protein LOC106467965 [Limulus polyphemus]|uniref:Uncharacterized protein LOC106467965 n=1 Tax=Limulus polyphemus TaxID=6850 RepID=A0ABM1BKI1_LIMPO|nr:uncharacterized protein LOC106467965 [Limulus polyphemus]
MQDLATFFVDDTSCKLLISEYADFDSYWEDESKSKNRNRIRVGRQYQAIIPPLLKPGESDGRRLEDLETLKWKPNNLNDQELDEYFSVARAVSFFGRAIDKCQDLHKESDKCIQTALRGLLPWKPVKSIIEYYYQGKEERPGISHCLSDVSEASTSMFSPAKLKKESADMEDAGDPHTSLDSGSSEEPDNSTQEEHVEEPLESKQDGETESHPDPSTIPSAFEVLEVKPRKTELVPATPDLESSILGTLQFYFHGKLVLKLNAQQSKANGKQCQWVQSVDTPKVPFPWKARQYKKKYVDQSSVSELSEDGGTTANANFQEIGGGFIKKAKLKNDFAVVWPEESLVAPVHSPQSPSLTECRHFGRTTPHDGNLSPLSGVCSDPSDSDVSPLHSPVDKCSTKKLPRPNELCTKLKEELCVKPESTSPSAHFVHEVEGRKTPLYIPCHQQDPQKVGSLNKTKRFFSHVNCDASTSKSEKSGSSVPISYSSVLKTVLEATDKSEYKQSSSSSYKLNSINKGEVPLDLSLKSTHSPPNKSHAIESNWQTSEKLNSNSNEQNDLTLLWTNESAPSLCEFSTFESSSQIKLSPSSSPPDLRSSLFSLKSPSSSPVCSVSKQHLLNTCLATKTLASPLVASSVTNTLTPARTKWTSFSTKPAVASLASSQEQQEGLTYLSMPIYNVAYSYPTNCIENVNGGSPSSGVDNFSQENCMRPKSMDIEDKNSPSCSQEKEEIPTWITNRPVNLTSYFPFYPPHIYSYYPYAYNLAQMSWNGTATPAEESDNPLDLSLPLSEKRTCSPEQKSPVENGTATQVPNDETNNASKKGMLYQLLKKRKSVDSKESIQPQHV